jgi:hypothetical protein
MLVFSCGEAAGRLPFIHFLGWITDAVPPLTHTDRVRRRDAGMTPAEGQAYHRPLPFQFA